MLVRPTQETSMQQAKINPKKEWRVAPLQLFHL
jgi:hypothetical protein